MSVAAGETLAALNLPAFSQPRVGVLRGLEARPIWFATQIAMWETTVFIPAPSGD
jgi:hypothetical protein